MDPKKKPYSKISEPFFVDGSSPLRKILNLCTLFLEVFHFFWKLRPKIAWNGRSNCSIVAFLHFSSTMFLPAYAVYLPNFLFTYGMGVRGADRRRGEKFSNLGSLFLEIFHFFWYFLVF
jgi:hypothetical protein